MKCVVLGSGGLVGRYVCDALKKDYELITVSKSSPADRSIDLTNENLLVSLISTEKPDLVVNCVKGSMSTDEAEKNKTATWALNFNIPYVLAKHQPSIGFRLIQISSDWVYEGKEGEVYFEKSPTYPQNFYSYTKALADEFVCRTCDNFVVLRPGCIFGIDRRGANLFSRLRKAALEKQQSSFSRDQFSQPIYAKTLADLIHKSCKTKESGVFNAVGPDYLSRFDFAVRICDAFGWDKSLAKPVDSAARNIRIPQHLKLDISKINAQMGPVPSLEKQLGELRKEESIFYAK